MPTRLLAAIITITLALIFYTIGVWTEHFHKRLEVRHFVCFLAGLAFDATGTHIMTTLKGSAVDAGMLSLHGITGAAAIALMAIHAVWAGVVLWKKDEAAQKKFHRFSIVVWLIWLIPYILGMVMGMK